MDRRCELYKAEDSFILHSGAKSQSYSHLCSCGFFSKSYLSDVDLDKTFKSHSYIEHVAFMKAKEMALWSPKTDVSVNIDGRHRGLHSCIIKGVDLTGATFVYRDQKYCVRTSTFYAAGSGGGALLYARDEFDNSYRFDIKEGYITSVRCLS